MVEKFEKILDEARKANKEIYLFAVLKMDEITDRWTVIVSGPNFEDLKHKNSVFNFLVKSMLNTFTAEEKKAIARVGLFPLDNHLVTDLLGYKKGYKFSGSTAVNGNLIHEGFILESNENIKQVS